MSSATVRAAIAAFFSTPAIPGISKVHPAPPYWADGSEWQLNLQGGSGSIMAVHLIEDDESRVTVPVFTGSKAIDYHVGLMIFYQWLKPSNTLTPVDESAWSGPLDAIIDNVKARLRSDPNEGAPVPIWEAAQQPRDLKVVRDLPRNMNGKIMSWNVVEFHITEIITA